MKRWKKIVLLLVGIVILSQTPFIYRRYRLGRLHANIESLNAQRAAPSPDDPYVDYKGVIHVHSSLGGHSTGRFEDIVHAAHEDGLAFVVMTEHPSPYVNTAEATLKGLHDGILFLNGSEISAPEDVRLLVIPGIEPPDPSVNPFNAQQIITRAKGEGRLVFVAYPEQVRDWRLSGYDGVEIYNLYTNSKKVNYARLFFDGLWSYWSYPELLFATYYAKPAANVKRWDEINASGEMRAVAVAGNDAHANVGLSFRQLTGTPILELKLDPYERSFSLVRNHVLLEKGQALDTATLMTALRDGHSFIAFDLFGDAGGFRFSAQSSSEKRLMGDEIKLPAEGGVRLMASVPVKSRLVFFRDGQIVHEEKNALGAELLAGEKGVYRVEVYLDQLGPPLDSAPWIISNPIYVR
ncbi:MAG: hypothetical protein WCD76_00775 [Pyrinomonadaceae bacterium]